MKQTVGQQQVAFMLYNRPNKHFCPIQFKLTAEYFFFLLEDLCASVQFIVLTLMTCFYVCRVHAHLNAGKGTIVSLEDLYKQMVTLVNIGAGTDPEAKCVKQGGKSMREEPVSEPGGRESDRKRRRDRQRETKEGQK